MAGARQLTRARLDELGLGGDVHDAAVLIVSELVTNAVVHTASTRVVCELRCLGRRLRIAVQDQGHQPGGPRLRRCSDDEHGRGLLLVDAMSSCLGLPRRRGRLRPHRLGGAPARHGAAMLRNALSRLRGTPRPRAAERQPGDGRVQLPLPPVAVGQSGLRRGRRARAGTASG